MARIAGETINYNQETPSQMVAMVQNVMKDIEKLFARVHRSSPEAWGNVAEELEQGEHTQNLMYLIDLLTDIEDLTPLIQYIEQNKVYVDKPET